MPLTRNYKPSGRSLMHVRLSPRAAVVASLSLVVALLTGCAGRPCGAQNAVKPGATVEAYRLDPSAPRAGLTEPQTIGGFKVQSGPATLKPEAAAQLTDVVSGRYTYKTTLGKSDCPFKPQVGFRYLADSP